MTFFIYFKYHLQCSTEGKKLYCRFGMIWEWFDYDRFLILGRTIPLTWFLSVSNHVLSCLGVLPSPPGRVLTTGLSCAISNASHNMLSVAFISGSRLKLNTRKLDHIELLYQFNLPQKSFISTAILLKTPKREKSYNRFREKTAMINNIWMLIHACMSSIHNVNLGEFGLWNHNSSVKFKLIILNKSILVFVL